MNATESSHADEVKSMLPAIKGHRYARHIQSYALNTSRDKSKFVETIGDMQIVDPRGNMLPMMGRIWYLKSEKGRNSRGSDAFWYAYFDRSITFTGLLEAYNTCADTWWDSTEPYMRKRWAEDFRVISPHSPQALRMAIMVAQKPTYEQLTQWESEAGEDPTVYTWLGGYFAQLEHYDDAIRAYERSIKLSPSKDAFVALASTHRAAGQEDLWLPTLERFFQVESLGLEHASVHSLIANDLIDKSKWEEALPHAEAAAETWSAWGLELASRVNGGLGHWDDSEKWIREDVTSYPSSSGDEWYFWCRRTGRGNLEEARKLAQTFFASDWIKTNLDGQLKLFTYRLSEGDTRAAFEVIKNCVKLAEAEQSTDDDRTYEQLHLALVARELKETDVLQAAIKETRRLSENVREKYPEFSAMNFAVCDVLDGKSMSDADAEKISGSLEKAINKNSRCNYQYFLGRALDLAGNKDQAEKYWKQCVTRGPFDRYNATLAGKYLSDRHKTSRP